jgi:CheY-specific phosphatase CheX
MTHPSDMKSETKHALDAVLINALIASTKDIFITMANVPIEVKEVKPQAEYNSVGDLSSIIGIMGDHGEGMISLSFSIELANIVVSRLLGSSPGSVTSDDRCDGIGEMVNMISGNTKTALSRESHSTYRLSLPTIIMGKGHEVQARPKNSPYLLIVFEAEGKEFTLQVTFKFNE